MQNDTCIYDYPQEKYESGGCSSKIIYWFTPYWTGALYQENSFESIDSNDYYNREAETDSEILDSIFKKYNGAWCRLAEL